MDSRRRQSRTAPIGPRVASARPAVVLAVVAVVGLFGFASAAEPENPPRFLLQASLLRAFTGCYLSGEHLTGWNAVVGGYELGAVAVGYSFAPNWAVAVGTKYEDQFGPFFEEGGISRLPIRLFIANHGGVHPWRTRVVYANVDVQPEWLDNNGYTAVCLGITQTFYGLTPGAEFRWQMPAHYLPYSQFALGVTLGLGGWYAF
jgi:hypothetical protein